MYSLLLIRERNLIVLHNVLTSIVFLNIWYITFIYSFSNETNNIKVYISFIAV